MSARSNTLTRGVILDDRYRLEAPIGDGGMGHVWSATNLSLGRERVSLGKLVAIKILHGSLMTSAEHRELFAREARLMGQLADMSRHITRVLEHGVLADGVPYLVMELLEGEGLEARLKRERIFPLAQVQDIVSQLCQALSVAHAENIIHRDIKPANVFLCPGENGKTFVKLLDFGVAKALASEGAEITVAGAVIGTPNYMSPEQLTDNTHVDHRADLFAVGAITYRCVTGRTPFGKGNIAEMAVKILTENPPAPTSINPALPSSFDAFIAKALAKRPEDRFQSARALSESLQKLGVSEESSFSAPLPAVSIPPPAPAPPRRSRTGLLVALGAAVLVLTPAATAALLVHGRSGSRGAHVRSLGQPPHSSLAPQ